MAIVTWLYRTGGTPSVNIKDAKIGRSLTGERWMEEKPLVAKFNGGVFRKDDQDDDFEDFAKKLDNSPFIVRAGEKAKKKLPKNELKRAKAPVDAGEPGVISQGRPILHTEEAADVEEEPGASILE